MCGISCCLSCSDLRKNREFQQWWAEMQDVLCRRGPDWQCQNQVDGLFGGSHSHDDSCKQDLPLEAADGDMPQAQLLLSGCVLHLRGELTAQPLQCSNGTGNLLLWNGEIFGGIQCSAENDTAVLLKTLSTSKSTEEVLSVFSRIRGPWAVIFWQAATQRLWFGRDCVGRRSLLWSLPTAYGQPFLLSSVSSSSCCQQLADAGQVWAEVPAVGLFMLDIRSYIKRKDAVPLLLHKWSGGSSNIAPSHPVVWEENCDLYLQCPVLPLNMELAAEDLPESVVLDCSQLRQLDVAESAQALPDDRKGRNGKDEQTVCADLNFQKRADDKQEQSSMPVPHDAAVCLHSKPSPAAEQSKRTALHLAKSLVSVLSEAVRVRTETIPPASVRREMCNRVAAAKTSEQACTEHSCTSGQAGSKAPQTRLAVLFSGGVDSMVLAALAGRHVPAHEPIDLINVAFEQEAKPSPHIAHQQSRSRRPPQPEPASSLAHQYDVPDRRTGLAGLRELASDRVWNFIEVNVRRRELIDLRPKFISHLVQPCCSVLDDSIGCALWFAARGQGRLLSNNPVPPHASSGLTGSTGSTDFHLVCEEYASPAKVLLVGMGADEQLGGYSRHRQKFLHGGWHSLLEEMSMDIGRIGHRNLGRDDRCISDHGREARFPFLDESVMSFLNSLPIHHKADLRLPRGVGEKVLLRNAARLLGLTEAAGLPKRAIQFGSRIARQEAGKEKGSDVCQRLSLPTR